MDLRADALQQAIHRFRENMRVCIVVEDTQHMPQTLLQRRGPVSEFLDQCAGRPSKFSTRRTIHALYANQTYLCTNTEQSMRELIAAIAVAAASWAWLPLWRSP